MNLLCRHEWEHKKKPNKVVLVQCRKCGKTDLHSKNKEKPIPTAIITYICPNCG